MTSKRVFLYRAILKTLEGQTAMIKVDMEKDELGCERYPTNTFVENPFKPGERVEVQFTQLLNGTATYVEKRSGSDGAKVISFVRENAV